MNTAYRRHSSIILMYLKQMHKVSACSNTPVSAAMSVHEWRRESGWGLARALSAHQCRLA